MTDDEAVPDAADPAAEPVAPVSPALRVVSGQPSAQELAALVVVLCAVGGDGSRAGARPSRSPWADPSWRLVGASATRGGWRSASLPR